MRQVVITGYSATCGPAVGIEQVCKIWRDGRCNFSPITRFSPRDCRVWFAAEAAIVNPTLLPDRKFQKTLNEKDMLSLLTMIDAVEAAKAGNWDFAPERIGLFVGAGNSFLGDLTPYFPLVRDSVEPEAGKFDSLRFGSRLLATINPMVVMKSLLNNSLCFGARTLDARGPNGNYMDHAAAGMRALVEAYQSVAVGRLDVAVAGGVSATMEPFNLMDGYWEGLWADSSGMADGVSGLARPYSYDRVGAVPAEAAVYFVLESADSAAKRGATQYARVLGVGLGADGNWRQPGLHSRGVEIASRQALQTAQLLPGDLGGIFGGGGGARVGDQLEAAAFVRLLGPDVVNVPISTVKGNAGDAVEASGPLHVVAAIDALERTVMPAVQNFSGADAEFAELSILREPEILRRSNILISTRSQLGVCAAMVLAPAS